MQHLEQTTIDRERLVKDLRLVVDAIVGLLPAIPSWLPMMLGHSLDLRSAGYKSCDAIAKLPDADLHVVLWVIERELALTRGSDRPVPPAPDPTVAQVRAAFAKVIAALDS